MNPNVSKVYVCIMYRDAPLQTLLISNLLYERCCYKIMTQANKFYLYHKLNIITYLEFDLL